MLQTKTMTGQLFFWFQALHWPCYTFLLHRICWIFLYYLTALTTKNFSAFIYSMLTKRCGTICKKLRWYYPPNESHIHEINSREILCSTNFSQTFCNRPLFYKHIWFCQYYCGLLKYCYLSCSEMFNMSQYIQYIWPIDGCHAWYQGIWEWKLMIMMMR